MLYYSLFVTAVLFVLMIICFWNLYILRKRKYQHVKDEDLPFVSVLVPARNEEPNIENILTSLAKQNYPNYEVIVLDDNSDDRTPEIINDVAAKYPVIKKIHGKPFDSKDGWTGKCFACKQLADEAKGEYILFTDADTTHTPESLRNSMTIALSTGADMITLFPKMTMISFAEKLIMPMLWFTIMILLPFYFVDKRGFVKFSVGIGPFMLFKRSSYDAIGGHASVKSAIVEDVWLARKIKENRMLLVVKDGAEMLSVRMYRSFSEIWNGFSKNIFAGFEFSSFALFSVNILYFLLFFIPFLLLFIQLSLQFGSYNLLILTALQVVFLYIMRAAISARFRLGFLSTILHPLGALAIPVIALNSWRWIASGKGAKWKGRVYNPAGASSKEN
jgi:chlorobactene glucosyltransferase